MREMSLEMAALLKSKTMIGDNRPTHNIILEGGTIEEAVFEFPISITQGVNSTSYTDISNYIPTNDGRYMCICTINGELVVGYTSDEKFFWVNYPWETTLAYPTISNGINNVIPIKSQHYQGTSLFKRDDGKVLAFISDKGTISSPTRTFCLISNSGNGDDFEFYSTLLETGLTSEMTYNSSQTNIPIQINTANGKRLIINFANMFIDSGYRFLTTYVYTSDDDGLTWVQRIRSGMGGGFTLIHSLGQIVKLKNGVLYYELLWSSDIGNVVASYDGGSTWETILSEYQTNNGTPNYHRTYYANWYYDKEINVLFRVSHIVYDSKDSILVQYIDKPTHEKILDKTNWIQLEVDSQAQLMDLSGKIVKMPSGRIAISYLADSSITTYVLGFKIEVKKLQAKKIDIQRQKGMAGGLTIYFDNKQGILAPDGTMNPQLLWPNTEIVVEQGYGNKLLQTFKGLIDSVSMQANGQQADISISARDSLKRALDQTITTSIGTHVITALDTTVEAIWVDLATMAGLTIGTVEETGITLSEKLFSWETYGDAFSWLDELVGFETYCDWDGVTHFRKDGRPETIEIAYIFREGEDIIQIGYEINDKDLYRQVIVHGKKTLIDSQGKEVDEVIEVMKNVPNADYFGILPHKILKIDASEADTVEKCEIIADKAIYLMATRARIVQFQSIGIPHLERGDFIEVIESSTTISEIYRITDISTTQTSETYTMNITCYHHAAPVV